MKKINCILLLVALLILLIGSASATNTNNDVSTCDTSKSVCIDAPVVKVAVEEKSIPTMDVQENTTEKSNKIIKEEKNMKTAPSYDVTNYQQLYDKLTASDDEITVNIKENITLDGKISIKPKYVTINGEEHTIDGAYQYHFLDISSGQTVIINNLTITNCTISQDTIDNYNGGAITNYGNLTINHSTLQENRVKGWYGVGGAITSYGNLTINNTQLTNNTADSSGGAICNYNGTLTVTNTLFADNYAIYGSGAIYNSNVTSTITNTQFTNNTASGPGGAIGNVKYSTLTMNNTQFTNNNAQYYGGAIYNYQYSSLTVNNTEFTNNNATNNGGAIYNYESTIKEISNTVFYNNTPANFIINQTTGNIQLENNDGYINLSKATLIVDGEEVLNNTEPEQLKSYPIPKGNHLVKIIVNGTNTTNNEYIISDTIDAKGYQGLIDAIEAAKKIQYVNVIINLQDEGNYNATANITYNESATRNITINGNGVTLDGQKTCQFIEIDVEHNLTLNNITITNYSKIIDYYVLNYEGAIKNKGSLIINDSILNNNVGYKGGAILNEGNLTLNGTVLNDNRAYGWYAREGGAIYNTANLTINNCTLKNNVADNGGAIYNTGTLIINDTTLNENNASVSWTSSFDGVGGALYNEGNLTIMHSQLNDNKYIKSITRSFYGEAIYNAGILTIIDVTLNNNKIDEYPHPDNGGASIYNNGTLSIKDSKLYNNYASDIESNSTHGGAIYNDGDDFEIINTEFNNNSPVNFIINSDNHIQIENNDGYISIGKFNLIIDDNVICTGADDLNKYEIPAGNHIIKLIVNGTDSRTINNVYHLESKQVNVTGYCELVNEIEKSKFNVYARYIICLLPGDYNATANITLNGSATRNINIYGNGITLDGKDTYQFIDIGQRHNITIENITITNYTAYNGGAISNNGTLTLNNVKLNNNRANSSGGAIHNRGSGVISINNAIINNNQAGYIGAISNNGNLTINNTTLNNNQATKTDAEAGAIYNYGNLIINNSRLNNNKALNTECGGGAIYNHYYGIMTMTNSILKNNQVEKYGGAIYNQGNATIKENYFIANKANIQGKAIINESTATIENNINADTSIYSGTIYTLEKKFEDESTIIIIETTVIITNNIFYDQVNTTINISTNNYNPTVHDKINLTIRLKDQFENPIAQENITITIDQTKNITTNNEGIANIEYTIKANQTLVNATYHGSQINNQNSTTLLVTAQKLDTQIYVDDVNTAVGKACTITGTLLDIEGNPVKQAKINITVNDTTNTTTTNDDGQFNMTITIHEMGEYPITAVFHQTEVYNPSTNNTAKVTATKTDTKLTLTVSNTTIVNSTNITITVNLTDIDKNPLSSQDINITIGDEQFTIKTGKDGIATKQYKTHKPGLETITANYNGNNIYNGNSSTTEINIIKINTKVTLQVSNKNPINSTPINITVTLTDTNGNKLKGENMTITVADKTYTVQTNNNGVAIQSYMPTKVETQQITAVYKGNSKYVNSSATTNITVKKINTKLTIKVSNSTPINNTTVNITTTLTDANANKIAGENIILNINAQDYALKTDSKGMVTQIYTPSKIGTQTITATYKGNSKYNNSSVSSTINVINKYNTKTTVNTVTGVIGEKLTIKTTVYDENNKAVDDGNLIFKVNGVTIKDNGRLTGSTNPLKVKVVNGVATATIIPDINMVNAKNITASYVGTNIYNKSTSKPAKISISKRNATIEVTTNKRVAKQGQVLTITAKIYDTTNGKKTTNITKYQDEYVYFKVNGITLKDKDGNMLKVKIVNGTATVNYTIPLGISCVTDTQTMTPKNQTIQVGLYNKNYENIMTKTPTFQVERSNITINIANATINNKTHKLSLQATIKDFLGNIVSGPNKCVIKVNGVTLKNGTKAMYFYTTDGILNIRNVNIPASKNYSSIEIITQDRLAYKSQRNTTNVIKIKN